MAALARDARVERQSLVDFLLTSNASISEYIRFADKKAGAVIAGCTALAGAAAVLLTHTLATIPALGSQFCAWLAVTQVVFLAQSCWSCLNALSPRVPKSGPTQRLPSLVSFPDIESHTHTTRLAFTLTLSENDLLDQLLRHQRTLSIIATQKYECLDAAFRSLAYAVAVLALSTAHYLLPLVLGLGDS